MPKRQTPEDDQNQLAEQRLQIGAALMLGCVVLVVVVMRAGVHTVFPAGWWRHW